MKALCVSQEHSCGTTRRPNEPGQAVCFIMVVEGKWENYT